MPHLFTSNDISRMTQEAMKAFEASMRRLRREDLDGDVPSDLAQLASLEPVVLAPSGRHVTAESKGGAVIVTVVIPFEGHADLLMAKGGNQYFPSPPDGEVVRLHGQHLKFEVMVNSRANAEAVAKVIDDHIALVNQGLSFTADQVRMHNERVNSARPALIAERRALLDMVDELEERLNA